jgi:hypothetical protein
MRAMVVEVSPEIEQLVFEICHCPEKRVIQIFASKGAHNGSRVRGAAPPQQPTPARAAGVFAA